MRRRSQGLERWLGHATVRICAGSVARLGARHAADLGGCHPNGVAVDPPDVHSNAPPEGVSAHSTGTRTLRARSGARRRATGHSTVERNGALSAVEPWASLSNPGCAAGAVIGWCSTSWRPCYRVSISCTSRCSRGPLVRRRVRRHGSVPLVATATLGRNTRPRGRAGVVWRGRGPVDGCRALMSSDRATCGCCELCRRPRPALA